MEEKTSFAEMRIGLKEIAKRDCVKGRHKPNPRNKKITKAELKLRMRIDDWKKGPQGTYATRVKSIWDGGYHQPGSNK